MSGDHFFWLDQIQTAHRDRVGSKAFYLAMLLQRGYPVIPGVVVSAELFQNFLGQINWTAPIFADLPHSSLHLDVDNPRQLQLVAQQIRQAIEATPLPEPWQQFLAEAAQIWQTDTLIFRPSLALQAGLDPNISHRTTGLLEAKVCWAAPGSIALALKQVWAELFRARSLLYWQRLAIQPQQIHLAVLVQPLRSAIASGDVQIQEQQLEIRSVWGLGQALVRGEAAPDRYQINGSGKLQARRSGKKTIAYEVAPAPRLDLLTEAAPTKDGACLKARLLNSEEQNQLTLSEAQLNFLLTLVQQVTETLDLSVGLEWTFCHPSDQAEPTFFITQAIPQLSSSGRLRSNQGANNQPASSSASSTLHGIAAAPGKAMAVAWVLNQNAPIPSELPPNQIFVASALLPEWILSLKHAAGIITEQGGMTSHAAILAREIGIPAVVGVPQATQQIQTGDTILVDGDRGKIQRMTETMQLNLEPTAESLPAETINSHSSATARFSATQLMVSLSRTDAIEQVAALAVDGVGLLRSELFILEALERRPPDLWLQQDKQGLIDRLAEQIQKFTAAFAPRPVFYRSLDVRSHEFPSLKEPTFTEQNPAMGMRGAFRYQVNPALFEVELAALRQAQQAGQKNLRLVLPFVRTVEEFQFCRQKVEQAGLMQPHFQLWIMAEVPSVLLLLEDYIQAGVQGIAIGTNDLTQLLFGVDRDHPQMANHFDASHPAAQRAIQTLLQTARSANLPCLICGHIPQDAPEMIDSLIRQGITAISVEPGDVDWMSAAIERAERRLLLELVRNRQS